MRPRTLGHKLLVRINRKALRREEQPRERGGERRGGEGGRIEYFAPKLLRIVTNFPLEQNFSKEVNVVFILP